MAAATLNLKRPLTGFATKHRSYFMKFSTLFLIAGMALAHTANAARVDLSKYTDLSDGQDDAAAFAKAIADAGDGGVVYIPAGTVILKSPVLIKNQSLAIVGDGLSVTTIEPDFTNGKAALSFVATADNKTPCRWSLSEVLLNAGGVNVGAAVELADERGIAGDARMKIANVTFNSATENYFQRGIIINGMAKVDLETSYFVGKLKGVRLTQSHVRLQGKLSGIISLFLCHLRMAQSQFEVTADFERLSLRQVSLVQCTHLMDYDRPERAGKWIYMNGCASQLEQPWAVRGVDYAEITSSRFILRPVGNTNPCIEMKGVPASIVAGNFLHNTGIRYENAENGVVFGNHYYVGSGEIQLDNSRNFELGNNFSQGGSGKAADTVKVSGQTKNLMLTETKEVR